MNSLAPASAELRALVEQLWPGVLVTTGDVPSGHRMAERYAVVPSFENAQFLVPLVTKRAAAASLLRYNALRPLRKRIIRSVLGTGFLLGVARLAVRDTLTVCAPEDADLLGRHLGRELGMDGLVFGVGVHRLDPNSKPTDRKSVV